MSWMMAPPYAYACAVLRSSGVAFGNRLSSSGLIAVSHAESIIASCERTEYAPADATEVTSNRNPRITAFKIGRFRPKPDFQNLTMASRARAHPALKASADKRRIALLKLLGYSKPR